MVCRTCAGDGLEYDGIERGVVTCHVCHGTGKEEELLPKGTLEEQIQEICRDVTRQIDRVKAKGRERLLALFQAHRDQVFKISQQAPEHWELERSLKERSPKWHDYLRREGLAFITCSCGSREDSCAEDGEGNFSTFIFAADGSVFRRTEKKQ